MKKEGFTSFKIDGWTLYSYEKVPSELEAFTKTAQEKGIDALGDVSDDSLIKEKNPLIRMIAEKQMGNHTYRIYLDYRFGSINRQILMCDEKWICAAEGNIGQLMAFAEYLNLNEKFGALEKLENGFFFGDSLNDGQMHYLFIGNEKKYEENHFITKFCTHNAFCSFCRQSRVGF